MNIEKYLDLLNGKVHHQVISRLAENVITESAIGEMKYFIIKFQVHFVGI